jgi:hypothetical protein
MKRHTHSLLVPSRACEYYFCAMAIDDPEQDIRLLRERYSRMTEDELLQAAKDVEELTDSARKAIADELRSRSLAAPGPAGWDAWEGQNWITVAQYRDLPEALLAKGSLESAATECHLVDDNLVRLDWLWSNLLGGVKLVVKPEEEQSAREMLSQPIPERIEVVGIGDYEQPRCPRCQSLDVNFQELDPAAYLSLAISVPIPFHRKAWRCHSCRAEWEDDGAEAVRSESHS